MRSLAHATTRPKSCKESRKYWRTELRYSWNQQSSGRRLRGSDFKIFRIHNRFIFASLIVLGPQVCHVPGESGLSGVIETGKCHLGRAKITAEKFHYTINGERGIQCNMS